MYMEGVAKFLSKDIFILVEIKLGQKTTLPPKKKKQNKTKNKNKNKKKNLFGNFSKIQFLTKISCEICFLKCVLLYLPH